MEALEQMEQAESTGDKNFSHRWTRIHTDGIEYQSSDLFSRGTCLPWAKSRRRRAPDRSSTWIQRRFLATDSKPMNTD